jgi:hypothetical protein
MPNPEIPDVTETDLTREELEEAAEEVGVYPDGLDDQQLLEQLGVALGEIDEDAVETPDRSNDGGAPEEGDGEDGEDDDGEDDDGEDDDGEDDDGEDDGGDVQEAVGEPIDGPTRDELREELRELDLPVSGTKDELAERLEEAKQEEG